MKDTPIQLNYEIELQEGVKLSLPEELVAGVGPGRWQRGRTSRRFGPPMRSRSAEIRKPLPLVEAKLLASQLRRPPFGGGGQFYILAHPYCRQWGPKDRQSPPPISSGSSCLKNAG